MFGLISKQYIVDIFLYFQYYLPDCVIRWLLQKLLAVSDKPLNEKREQRVINKIKQCEKTTYEVEKANEGNQGIVKNDSISS
jgi:hypothetical protein